MNSGQHGADTSRVEVTNISGHGIWLLASGTEMFLSYDDFPWFRDAPVSRILKVEEPVPGHYHWPDLDIDLSADMIARPDRYPLKAR